MMAAFSFSEFLSIGDRNEMMFISPTSDTKHLEPIDEQFHTEPANPVGNSANADSLIVSGNFQCQGLSLSLGTEMQPAVSLPLFQYQNSNLILPSLLSPNLSIEGAETNQTKGFKNPDCLSVSAGHNHSSIKPVAVNSSQCFDEHKEFHTDMFMYGSSNYSNVLNAKYLKAALELLNELASTKKALTQPQSVKCFDHMMETDGGSNDQSAPPTTSGVPSSPRKSIELSPTERQELQNKKTKLVSMFDEVNKRYKKYYHQMQFVETSFDLVVGQGAAKSYTTLAFQTISRHFRCLHDAISSQIEIIRKRLGEADNGQGPLPRLRLADQQLRQQRAVMQHAWRPQRGLPDNSVYVLRAWLFEHFLHPYPNDSEKIKLAKQTGLTRNQVANWFINARVRLWKPMVEDIYKEEFGDLEGNSKSSQDGTSKPESRLDKLKDCVTSADSDSKMIKHNSDEKKVTANLGFINFQHNYSYYSDKNIPQDQYGEDGHETDAFAVSNLNHIRGNNSIAFVVSKF